MKNSCKSGFSSVDLKFYIGYSFIAWGDNAWMFVFSLALFEIGGNLQLPAVSNLVNSLSVLVFGAMIGNWIDKSERIKGLRYSLVIYHICLIFASVAFFLVLYLRSDISELENGKSIFKATVGIGIFLGGVSVLTGTAVTILITKDWIVVISGEDKDKLASMNAWLIRIDLAAMILSPLVVGQIMTSLSNEAACMFVAVWSFASFWVEYIVLSILHREVPALKASKTRTEKKTLQELGLKMEADDLLKPPALSAPDPEIALTPQKSSSTPKDYLLGWRVYFQQEVLFAAIGLAMLYLTVMGFDGITSSYIVSQGIKPNILAIIRGFGALTGIIGTFLYVRFRSWIGLLKTGAAAFSMQISFLLLCILSIWLPGSPFDPNGKVSDVLLETKFIGNISEVSKAQIIGNISDLLKSKFTGDITSSGHLNISTMSNLTYGETINVEKSLENVNVSQISVWTFLVGLVLSRIGLWMADLSVTQIMQEEVVEEKRGTVFGTQTSLCQMISLIKDLLVVFLPHARTFGILIIVSVVSICTGFFSYLLYFRRHRGKEEESVPEN